MIVLGCPWCDDELATELEAFLPPAEAIDCAACGTTIALVEDEREDVRLAA